MERRRSFSDILAGAIFVVIGLGFTFGSLGYQLGTPLRMGPGYFPLLIGVVLVALGLGVTIKGLVAGELIDFGTVPWRAIGLIVAALVIFGLTVRLIGLVPAILITALLGALASRRIRLRTALLVSVSLTALCVLIFVVGLRLRLPLFGSWLIR